MFWITIIGIFSFIYACFFIVQFYNIIFRGFAPFCSTKYDVIKKILEEIKPKPGAKVYELGCGKAGFLRAIEEKFPNTELIGIEYSFLPYFMARTQAYLGKSKIKIVKKNIFKVNLSDADLVYCYFNIKTMADLEKKFKAECRTGTEIISYTFPLPNIKPRRVDELSQGKKIFFYTL